jgi:hypothetical protein
MDINIHDPLELLILGLMRQFATTANTGVIHSDIQAAKLPGDLGDAVLDLLVVAHVHAQGQDLDVGEALFEDLLRALEVRHVDVCEGEVCDAVAGECECCVLADAWILCEILLVFIRWSTGNRVLTTGGTGDECCSFQKRTHGRGDYLVGN